MPSNCPRNRFGPSRPRPRRKSNTYAAPGATVLPEIRLVILSPALACLHIDRGFICLKVTAVDQLSPHRGDHRDQQLTDFQDPTVQRRSADLQADVSSQNHALPIQRRVIAIFADHRVYDDAVSVASSDDGQACRSLNPDCGKTRCVACRCSQTPLLTPEFPRGCVGGSPTFSVFHSSSHFTTDPCRRKGVLPRRLLSSLQPDLRRSASQRGVKPLIRVRSANTWFWKDSGSTRLSSRVALDPPNNRQLAAKEPSSKYP